MPYVNVWVDDDEFDISECDDEDLIKELQKRGYFIGGKLYDEVRGLSGLYSTYMTMSPEFFQKELKRFFRENLDVSIY